MEVKHLQEVDITGVEDLKEVQIEEEEQAGMRLSLYVPALGLSL